MKIFEKIFNSRRRGRIKQKLYNYLFLISLLQIMKSHYKGNINKGGDAINNILANSALSKVQVTLLDDLSIIITKRDTCNLMHVNLDLQGSM